MSKAVPDFSIESLAGLKERELVALGACALCKRPLLDAEKGGPTFYRVTLSRGLFDRDAIRRRVGLGMQLGDAIAQAMGPDEDIAKIFDGPIEVVVHEGCAAEVHHLLRLWPEASDG